MKNINEKIKVAMVGAGAISDSHAVSWNKSNKAKVVAVMNRNIEKAKDKAEKWDIPGKAYDSIEGLLDSEKPDLIDICTSECAHADSAISILDQGIPVFCEKIMATSLLDGFRMVRGGSWMAVPAACDAITGATQLPLKESSIMGFRGCYGTRQITGTNE